MALRALSRDPNLRPRSAGALARELRAWLADGSASASASASAPAPAPASVDRAGEKATRAVVARPATGPLSPSPHAAATGAPNPRPLPGPSRLEPITLLEGPQDSLPTRRSPLRPVWWVAAVMAAALLAWWMLRGGSGT
jgi:serine/threonine-protein kinase